MKIHAWTKIIGGLSAMGLTLRVVGLNKGASSIAYGKTTSSSYYTTNLYPFYPYCGNRNMENKNITYPMLFQLY